MDDFEKEQALDIASDRGWLRDLDKTEAARLIENSQIKHYASDQVIYTAGDTQDNLYCVIDGLIKISIIGEQGDNFPLAIWEAGSCFGDAAFVDKSVMPLEVVTLENTKVLAIPISAIDSVLENSAVFYKNVLHDILIRTQLLFKLIKMLLFNTLQARVAARILHLISLFGEPSAEGTVLPLELSQSDFARMSGGSRQRVNIIFRGWSNRGIVSKKKQMVCDSRYRGIEGRIRSIILSA